MSRHKRHSCCVLHVLSALDPRTDIQSKAVGKNKALMFWPRFVMFVMFERFHIIDITITKAHC